ncbi:hypothetical protein A3Q56_01580 [Intoshia linei]|uniref:Uncharacterized protein n=1 Tax=Intoshia linei TaxID=1819745 RepID=A0A177BB30_9BILA|nr:hypothetical protein A3Q56_01580 [Intoshia linei]
MDKNKVQGVIFKKCKKPKKLNLRCKKNDIQYDNSISNKVEISKNIQKNRNKPKGLCFNLNEDNVVTEIVPKKENDNIAKQFSIETNFVQEDKNMLNFILDRLSTNQSQKDDSENVKLIDSFYALPENIANITSGINTNTVESNQVLTGIPEVDLGIEYKYEKIAKMQKELHNFTKNKENLP